MFILNWSLHLQRSLVCQKCVTTMYGMNRVMRVVCAFTFECAFSVNPKLWRDTCHVHVHVCCCCVWHYGLVVGTWWPRRELPSCPSQTKHTQQKLSRPSTLSCHHCGLLTRIYGSRRLRLNSAHEESRLRRQNTSTLSPLSRLSSPRKSGIWFSVFPPLRLTTRWNDN